MKKNRTTLALVILLTLLMVISLVGCKSDDKATTEESGTTKTTQEGSSDKESASESEGSLSTYSLRILTAGDQPSDQQTVLDKVEEVTKDTLNLDLTVDYIPWADYIEKVRLMSAATEKIRHLSHILRCSFGSL